MTKSDKNATFHVDTFAFQVHNGPILGQGAQEYWDTQIWDQMLWASTQPLHHIYLHELVVLIELGP